VHVQTHLILSWLTGHRLNAWRDRLLIAWAGVAPDLDGLSLLAGVEAYSRWHHVLTHGLFAALAVSGGVALLAQQKRQAALLAFAAFHLHLICDFLGSGREWGIVYLYPLSGHEVFSPVGWALASWQNVAVTALALIACGYTSVRFGRSFLEAFLPSRVDAAISQSLRERFGRPSAKPESDDDSSH
jgi:hypothetical protein